MAGPYPRQHSRTWFLKNWAYRRFMLCELSALFLAGYTVLLVVLFAKVRDGEKAFDGYADTLGSPGLIAFHVVALAFALLHTVTWLRAVPKALPIRRGEKTVAPSVLIGATYSVMAAASAAVLVVVLS